MKPGEYRKQKILLVEDDLHVRDCFESLLEFDGHQVQSVDGGDAALAMLETESFDLIITDYWMPHMKGDELARLIKEQRPHQPIIMASGSLAQTSAFESSIAGVDCLLNKPFSLTELREAIVWVLDLYADSRLGMTETVAWPESHPESPAAAKHKPFGGET
jgi:two-component system, cell cycle response regulator CpdR